MAVARIAGIGQQDPLVAVDEQRHHQQQRRRRAGGDDHALGRDVDAVVVARSARAIACAQLGQARAPTCSRCRRRRARAAPRRAPAPASGNRARRSPCGRRCGRPPRARARRSAPPSRGTARCRRRGRRGAMRGIRRTDVGRGGGKGAMVLPSSDDPLRPWSDAVPRTVVRDARCACDAASAHVPWLAASRRRGARSPIGVATPARARLQVRGRRRHAGLPGHAVPGRAGAAQFRRRPADLSVIALRVARGAPRRRARRRHERAATIAARRTNIGKAAGRPRGAQVHARRHERRRGRSRSIGAPDVTPAKQRPPRALDVPARARRPADTVVTARRRRSSRSSARREA